MKKHKCRKCGGKGYDAIVIAKYKDENRDYKKLCMFCLGEGKVDWVKNVIGPPKVTNTLQLIKAEMSAKFGNYVFSLSDTHHFIVNEEFLLIEDFEEKWQHVLMSTGKKTWRITDDPTIVHM